MVYVGLDFSRKRLQWSALDGRGGVAAQGVVVPDQDGLRDLVGWASRQGEPVLAAIESMTGARFVHDQLERLGWDVLIADAQRVKGLAPLACKTDRIDARVLAVLSERRLVPEIWLPDPSVRAERELARFRLHLVKHRSMLKNRIHSTLINFGHQCPVSDLFGVAGREHLERLELPAPWRATVDASLHVIDDLDARIAALAAELKSSGANHPYVPLLQTAPGICWVLGYTIAAEIGQIERFDSPVKLT